MFCGESDHSPSIEVSNLGRWLLLNTIAKALAYYFMVHDRDDSVVWAAIIFVYASTALVFLTFHRMKVARVKLDIDEGEPEWTTAVSAYVASVVAFGAFAHLIDHSVHTAIRANTWSPAVCNRYIASVVGAGAAEWERSSRVATVGDAGDAESSSSPSEWTLPADARASDDADADSELSAGRHSDGEKRTAAVDPFERVVAQRLADIEQSRRGRMRRRGLTTALAGRVLTADHIRAVARLIRNGEFALAGDDNEGGLATADSAAATTSHRHGHHHGNDASPHRHVSDVDSFGQHADDRREDERRAINEATVSSPIVHVLFAAVLLLDALTYIYTSRFGTVMHNSGGFMSH